jgi:hypothetical protein
VGEGFQKSADRGVGSPALGPNRCDVVSLYRVLRKNRDKRSAPDPGVRHEAGCHSDAGACGNRCEYRFAGVDNNTGPWCDLDFLVSDAESPTEHLTSALVAKTNRFVFV